MGEPTFEGIRAIRRKGILVQIHTVNDPEEMRYWLDLGLDSILTDRPDVLAEVIARRAETPSGAE